MALRGAPTGSKVGGQTRAGRTGAGRLARSIPVTGRSKMPLRGGNPTPNSLDALVSGRRAFGKLPGADSD